MRSDLLPGNPFPDLRLPDHTRFSRRLSRIADNRPLLLAFVHGWWCPKDQPDRHFVHNITAPSAQGLA